MTVNQAQQKIVDNLDINKLNNKYFSFNIVDIR